MNYDRASISSQQAALPGLSSMTAARANAGERSGEEGARRSRSITSRPLTSLRYAAATIRRSGRPAKADGARGTDGSDQLPAGIHNLHADLDSDGLSLFGKMGSAVGILLIVAIFLLLIPFSHWWMKRFRYGPAEWLWRSMTYLKLQPVKRSL